jgi:hypothetical protein
MVEIVIAGHSIQFPLESVLDTLILVKYLLGDGFIIKHA